MTVPQAARTRIIFDSDTTVTIPDCDVDDGLAMLFALGYAAEHESVAIEGICTSYGNSTQDAVYDATLETCAMLGIHAPVMRGAAGKEEPMSSAAVYLAQSANANPGKISLAVTGSTTNLKGALSLDASVLKNFKNVVFMGGITEPLVFNGTTMDELNLSCDPEATQAAFAAADAGANIAVMTSQHCLPAFFTHESFKAHIAAPHTPRAQAFLDSCEQWFESMQRRYGLGGFHCWDVLVPAYILMPELFCDEVSDMSLDLAHLNHGMLAPASKDAPRARINTPYIKDPARFIECAYHYWNAGLATLAESAW